MSSRALGRHGVPGMGAFAAAGALMVAMLFALPVLIVLSASASADTFSPPSAAAQTDIPPDYLALYQAAGESHEVDWAVLASVGAQETDHGRSSLPGVRSGVNSVGCCAGPMQFDVTDAGGNTWAAYGRDENGDGVASVYDPADAIPAAGRYLAELGAGDPDRVREALVRYSGGSPGYADQVLARAERYRGNQGLGTAGALSAAPPPGAGTIPEHGGDGLQPVGVAGFVFPIRDAAGAAVGDFSDDYSGYRTGGGQCGNHVGWHCAIDVFAARGTPIVAPISGRAEQVGWNTYGGWRLWVRSGSDGFYLAHLSAYADGFQEGSAIQAGQIVGYVGDTGSAQGTSPHLHIAWEHGPGRVNTNPVHLLRASRTG